MQSGMAESRSSRHHYVNLDMGSRASRKGVGAQFGTCAISLPPLPLIVHFSRILYTFTAFVNIIVSILFKTPYSNL